MALRILRTCREMGIRSVAVHSVADSDAMHVRLADESVCIGPARSRDSYLNMAALMSAVEVTGAQAVHPGAGFLSESPTFAHMVEDHGIVFIGPVPAHISLLGDKLEARRAAVRAGLSVLPASEDTVDTYPQARRLADSLGYPVLIKAAAGGGGRGQQVATSPDSLEQSLALARAEAVAAFGDDRLFIEKFLPRPRHIEVQVLGDGTGNAVHLGERDCSLQRRRQKLLEESPSPALRPDQRDALGERCRRFCAQIAYRGAGTMEFLYQDGNFYFLEMNTRLQVEHTITEARTGMDLVREQIHIAAGEANIIPQSSISFRGHAVECRVNAEHPFTFAPSPGRIQAYHPPGGLGVRVDSALYTGYQVQPFYDSLIAKLIVHDATREMALSRLHRALIEFVVDGIDTTLPLFRALLAEKRFRTGDYHISWLESFVKSLGERGDRRS